MGRIDGFPDYEVTEDGRVISNNYNRTGSSRELKAVDNSTGYKNIRIYSNGKAKRFYLHRLVAIAFIPNPDNKPYINHIDGDKSNNHKDNLEWSTRSENNRHAYDTGLNSGEKVGIGLSKMTVEQVNSARELRETNLSYIKIGKILGFTAPTIRMNVLGIKGTGKYMKEGLI